MQLFKDMKKIVFRITAIMALMMMTMTAQANRWSSENRAMLASAMSSRFAQHGRILTGESPERTQTAGSA